METPWFQIKNERYPEKIYAFSSNYELYASMLARVMNSLEELAPRVEQYSIDEMFLDLRFPAVKMGGWWVLVAPASHSLMLTGHKRTTAHCFSAKAE